MNFTESVTDGFKRSFDFTGRSPRSALWWWMAFGFLIIYLLSAIDRNISLRPGFTDLFILVIAVPTAALNIRRMRDIGRSRWAVPVIVAITLIEIIMFLGGYHDLGLKTLLSMTPIFVWLTSPSEPHANEFGHESA